MKWPTWEPRREELAAALDTFSANQMPLVGMAGPAERDALSMQLVASLRRDQYFQTIQQRGPIPARRADPADASFEAELGVVYFLQQGEVDEASWLIFLMVFLAKPEHGWVRLRDIYSRLGVGVWDWASVAADPEAFEQWMAENWMHIGGKFGNHRKYESLNPAAPRPMGPAVTRYVRWVTDGGGHQAHFARIVRDAGNDPHVIFDAFYHSLPINGFGRLGRFDWVAMLARYDLIAASAGSAYLKGATGPGYGARLLFQGDRAAKSSNNEVQAWLNQLDDELNVGMEVIEDALCNWQKTPAVFRHFKG